MVVVCASLAGALEPWSAFGTCDEARPITNTLCLMHRDVYLGLMSEI